MEEWKAMPVVCLSSWMVLNALPQRAATGCPDARGLVLRGPWTRHRWGRQQLAGTRLQRPRL